MFCGREDTTIVHGGNVWNTLYIGSWKKTFSRYFRNPKRILSGWEIAPQVGAENWSQATNSKRLFMNESRLRLASRIDSTTVTYLSAL